MLLLTATGLAAAAACPDAATRESHRAAATAATDGDALHAAWAQVRTDAVACASASTAAAAEADVLAAWADAARGPGDGDASQRLEEERRQLAHAHGLAAQEGDAALHLGNTLVSRGDVAAARERLLEALDAFRTTGDADQSANAHSALSRLDRRLGNYLPALRYELAALDIRRGLSPSPELWRSMLNLAVLYEQIELFDESLRYYAAALDEAERGGEPGPLADVLNGYAGFLNDFGAADAPAALAMAERALAIFRRDGNRARIGSCLLQVGRARLNLGERDAAAAAFAAALVEADAARSPALRAHVQYRRGELAMATGDLDAALALVEEARVEYDREGNRHRLVKVAAALEQLHAARGEELLSLRAGREHYRLRNELLGANATGKLGELLSNFQLTEERLRNERLHQANELAAATLAGERRLRTSIFVLAAGIGLALLVLAWRHVSMRRLYALLEDKSREVSAPTMSPHS